jgi:hypothetical protein
MQATLHTCMGLSGPSSPFCCCRGVGTTGSLGDGGTTPGPAGVLSGEAGGMRAPEPAVVSAGGRDRPAPGLVRSSGSSRGFTLQRSTYTMLACTANHAGMHADLEDVLCTCMHHPMTHTHASPHDSHTSRHHHMIYPYDSLTQCIGWTFAWRREFTHVETCYPRSPDI